MFVNPLDAFWRWLLFHYSFDRIFHLIFFGLDDLHTVSSGVILVVLFLVILAAFSYQFYR